MPLTVFDLHLGATRDATQEDIDIMQAKIDCFGRLISEFRHLEGVMANEIGKIHNRHQQTQDLSGDL